MALINQIKNPEATMNKLRRFILLRIFHPQALLRCGRRTLLQTLFHQIMFPPKNTDTTISLTMNGSHYDTCAHDHQPVYPGTQRRSYNIERKNGAPPTTSVSAP